MDRKETYDAIFRETFMLAEDEPLEQLDMLSVDTWNSVEHFSLVCALENEFGITISEEDILSLTSYARGLEILEKNGVRL